MAKKEVNDQQQVFQREFPGFSGVDLLSNAEAARRLGIDINQLHRLLSRFPGIRSSAITPQELEDLRSLNAWHR